MTPHAVQPHRQSGRPVRSDESLDPAEIDWFLSTTARLTDNASIQVLSDEKYIYVFRQAIAANHPNNILSNGVAVVDQTLLLDRFVYVDGNLTRKREVRYQRSRNKDLPASRKDALGYEDLEKKPFYEPTQELNFIKNLSLGQFSVVLIPTALPDVQRWQIFAYNSVSQRMDSFNIERSSDGLFNTRGTRYYTSADPARQKDVFQRSPVDPATGESLVPILSQSDYAESALAFGDSERTIKIPAYPALNFGSQDFTIELWLQVAPSTGAFSECTLFEQKGEISLPCSIRYLPSGAAAGKIRVDRSDGEIELGLLSTGRIDDGQFHHLAVVRTTNNEQQAQLTLFIDGQESGSSIDNTRTSPGEAPIFVASRDGIRDFFTGTIDELRVWNRGRSAAAIADDRHHRLIGNEPGLVGYWRLDEGSGETAYDQTDFINHAQLLNPQWITSEAPVGDHPGIRRSSFMIRDRNFTAGCSALLYYQQEPTETGYTSTEKKPMKRSARVMLAMTTAPAAGNAAGNADPRNYIAAMDFAVSREGALAQVPDVVDLKPVEGTGSQNLELDAIVVSEEIVRSQKTKITDIKAEIIKLRQARAEKLSQTQQSGVYFVYKAGKANVALNMGVGQYTVPQSSVTSYMIKLEPWASLTLNGQPSFRASYGGSTETGWINTGTAINSLTLTLDINANYYAELNQINAAIVAKEDELSRLESAFNTKQQDLDCARETLSKTVLLPMAFLHVDSMGLTTLGSLLKFAWTPDAPVLFESVDGRLSLYFRGEADQFFAAYYDVIAGRSSFRLSTVNSTQQSDGTVLFTARTSGAAMEETKITIAPSQSSTNPETCQVTIANSILEVQEVWNQVPREPQAFAAILNGTTQPVYVGRLLKTYTGEVSQLDLDGRRSQLTAGSVLLVGNTQTKVTVIKAEPMFDGTIGFKGQALEFDGEADYVQIPDAQALGLTNNSFTIEAWVSIHDFQGKNDDRPILGTDDQSQRLRDKALQAIVRKARPRMGFFENDTPSDTELKPNVWYHLSWRYDKAKQEQALFINGKLDKALTGRTSFSGTGKLAIGRWNGDRYFKGFIGEVRIWNEARSEADIRADMSRPLSDRSPKLTACWRFEYVPVGESRDPSNAPLKLIAKDYATDDPTRQRNGIVMGNPQLTAIGDHRRVQIQPIDLDIAADESVYLLPYDYAAHAQTQPAQIGWSLHNGSRLVVVDPQKAGEEVADSAQPAESYGGGLNCRWFADSQGNALEFEDGTPAVAPATNPADFAAAGDCSVEVWINPTSLENPVSIIQQCSNQPSAQSKYQMVLQPERLNTALSFNVLTDRLFIPGESLQLDLDSGAYEDESDGSGTSSTFISGSFTIEAKIYLDPITTIRDRTLLQTEKGTFQIGVRDNKLYIQATTRGRTTIHVSDESLSPQRWYHIACIYNADQPLQGRRLYSLIEGRPEAQPPSGVSGQLRLDRGELSIGGGTTRSFNGRIDEVRIWNRVRTNQEIKVNAKRRLKGQESGLIGYWHFENAGIRDYSSRLNHGYLTGNPPLVLGSFSAYRLWVGVGDQVQQTRDRFPGNAWNHLAAVFNQSYALHFDGQESCVNCGTERTLDITDDLTLELYLRPESLNGKRGLLHKGKQGEGLPYALFLDGNQLRFAYEDESGQYIELDGANYRLAENTFYRIAVTRQKRTETTPALKSGEVFDPLVHKYATQYDIKYYVQEGTQPTTEIGQVRRSQSARSSAGACQIGGAIAESDSGFQGAIAEVRIWNTARTKAELFSQFPATAKGLVSWWKFEENQGNLAYDAKGSNHGTRLGATWVKSPDPQGSQLSLYVNGEQQITTPGNPLSTIEPQFTIGTLKQGASYTQTFQGQLDEIRIWQTARTEEQIQDNLFRRLTSDFEQLIAYYNCDMRRVLEDQSGRSLHLDLLTATPQTAFSISAAPISNETAKVRSALAGVKTDFHDVISSAPGVQEYGDKQYDSDGNLIGIMKRCYSYIQAGKWRLISGFKVGDLELEWIGQAQYEPQLVGFIEGAPPVPSENLTVRDANQGEIYDEISAIELTEADRVMYTYTASKENGIDASLRFKAGIGLKSKTDAGIGVATTIEEAQAFVGLQGNIETSRGWLNEQQIGFAQGTSRLSRLNMQGSWENPNAVQYPAMGKRYIPKNVGFALVKSKTADIFALRLKHRDPEKRVTVALSMQPNPDIPEDWNIITFAINPRYTKQGTLDGRIGLSPDRKDYPNANDYSTDRSYFKPIEAYMLKNQIEKEQQQLTADYLSYSTNPLKAFGNQEAISKKLPTANQMNLFNTYVWTADGGFFAETQNTMSLKQEVIGGTFSLSGMVGGFVEVETAIAKVAVKLELEALLGGHLNLTSQQSRDSETAFGVNVALDVEQDITIKSQAQAELVGKGAGGLYDADGNPVKCPGKVDGYRFMTFYLKPDQEHFKDFSNKVIDRIWLEQSSDANAAALRQAIAGETGTPWRVLHRVTYVSRVLPELSAKGSVEETLRAANFGSNWELIQQLDPYVKAKTGSYAELKQAVEQTIDRYLPELAPAKADIVKYMSQYYQLFPSA